jgi:hypothetical protein
VKRVVLWLGSIAFFMFLSLWLFLGVIGPWLEYQSDTDPRGDCPCYDKWPFNGQEY